MQRTVSMSFSLFSLAAVMSLTALIGIPSRLISAVKFFNILGFLTTLCSITMTLLPFALVALLYVNTKRDVKKTTHTLLLVGSAVYALYFVRMMLLCISHGLPSIDYITRYVNILATTIALFLAANSIKKEQPNTGLRIFVAVIVYANLIPLGASLLAPSLMPSYDWAPLLVLLGLSMLPKTVYDHDNCVFVNKKSLTVLGVVLVVFLLTLVISSDVLNSSDSGSGSSSSGDTSICFNCNGSGYDSANNCTCVWCGGDGQTVLNP